jgi:hypothetical protein
MKNIFKHKMRILSLLFIFTALVFFSACEDDEEGSKEVVLLSFGPSGVHHGDEIVFIGENMDKVTAIVLPPGIEVTSFVEQTNERITIVVPDEAEAGTVVLKTPAGDIESKTMLNFEVPVQITNIPAEVKPGTTLTITGQMLNWIEQITFTSELVVNKEDFLSQSLTELSVTVPMEAQTGFLTFASGGTEPMVFKSEETLTVTLPTATSLSPTPVRHTEALTITGTDLDLVTQITFPDGAIVVSADFVSQSLTEIVVNVPSTAINGKLTFAVASGVEVESATNLSIELPNVTALSPSSTGDHNPGTTLTLTGTNLDLVASVTVPGAATPVSSFTSHSATEIQLVIPDGAKGGTLMMTTIHGFMVPITLPFGNQLQLAKIIFDEAIRSPFGAGGGWGGVTTITNSTENPRLGSISVKATFAGSWGGGSQFGTWGNSPLSTSGTTYFAFSIYGGPGTEGKEINVNISGNVKQVVIEEGEWKDVQILLSDAGSPASISEVWFQDRGWSGTVYIDHVGLK